MASFDYEKAQATAKRLIEKFGAAGTFTRSTGGDIDPATGAATTPSTITINGTVTPVLNYNNNEVDGTNILQGDGYVYFDGAPVAVGDTTSINGKTWRVVDVSGVKSVTGVLVYQKAQVRR